MAAGGGGGRLWIASLAGGGVALAAAFGLEHAHAGGPWAIGTLLALGGLAIVFGSCEAMIKCVEGIGDRAGLNPFVVGTMAGLASNVPEIVMLGFVIAKEPRVAFIVVALTLHLGALAFGIYSGLLPRDESGHAPLPRPLVQLSSDLYACAGAVFLTTGGLMLTLNVFDAGDFRGEGLGVPDLYVLGACLLAVQVVAVVRLVRRFSSTSPDRPAPQPAVVPEAVAESRAHPPSVGLIAFYGLLGAGTSVVGGHAVGDFAEMLVGGLAAAGYPEMVGAIILSFFACAGAYAMIAMAHAKGMIDVALANVSGQVTQMPFVVMPIVLILMAVFAQLGVIPRLEHGGVLPIDLETTSVLFLAFPPMLILWKSVQDDGMVNWLETTCMLAIFGLTLYFLAMHG